MEGEGPGLNNCMSPFRGPCADFPLVLCISANSVSNINTAKWLQRAEINLLAGEKGPQHWIQVLVYTIILAKLLKSTFYSFMWKEMILRLVTSIEKWLLVQES